MWWLFEDQLFILTGKLKLETAPSNIFSLTVRLSVVHSASESETDSLTLFRIFTAVSLNLVQSCKVKAQTVLHSS